MTAGTARAITVVYRAEAGLWWAESDDVPGWTASAGSTADMRRLVADSLEAP